LGCTLAVRWRGTRHARKLCYLTATSILLPYRGTGHARHCYRLWDRQSLAHSISRIMSHTHHLPLPVGSGTTLTHLRVILFFCSITFFGVLYEIENIFFKWRKYFLNKKTTLDVPVLPLHMNPSRVMAQQPQERVRERDRQREKFY
jgi:hypothetical protein